MAAQGRDIKLSKQRIEGYRNFITKIWNAAKLSESNKCQYEEIDFKSIKNPFNRWILLNYEQCRVATEDSIKNYRFNEAANELYKFTWNIFCDWYLEFTKSVFNKNEASDITETRSVTSFILTNILIMLHPIMPFFTEHLWNIAPSILKYNSNPINRATWPEKIELSKDSCSEIETLKELITAIRSTRSEMNVPANVFVELYFSEADNHLTSIIEKYEDTLFALTKINKISHKDTLHMLGLQSQDRGFRKLLCRRSL